jgi:hypothetical protein
MLAGQEKCRQIIRFATMPGVISQQLQMNVRHVAALLLVGWSLIMPPLSQDRQLVEKNAPLSRWDTIGTYDTAAACNHELDKLAAVVAGNISQSVLQRRVLAGKCIAADDPRIHSDNFEAY